MYTASHCTSSTVSALTHRKPAVSFTSIIKWYDRRIGKQERESINSMEIYTLLKRKNLHSSVSMALAKLCLVTRRALSFWLTFNSGSRVKPQLSTLNYEYYG